MGRIAVGLPVFGRVRFGDGFRACVPRREPLGPQIS